MDICQRATARCAVWRRLSGLRMRYGYIQPRIRRMGDWLPFPQNGGTRRSTRTIKRFVSSFSRGVPVGFRDHVACSGHRRQAFGIHATLAWMTRPSLFPILKISRPNQISVIQTIPDKTNSTITIDNSGIGMIKKRAREQSREDRQSWYGGHESRRRLLHD